MHTEKQAKDKWCPHALDTATDEGSYNRTGEGKIVPSCLCLASECMMWRWVITDPKKAYKGYCGLAGIP